MDKIFLIIFFGIGAVFIILAIKKYAPEYALGASICACCAVIVFVLSDIGEIISQWSGSIFKIALISFIGQWGISICRDAGENSIADKLETAVKVLVLIICLPYINMLFKMAEEIN